MKAILRTLAIGSVFLASAAPGCWETTDEQGNPFCLTDNQTVLLSTLPPADSTSTFGSQVTLIWHCVDFCGQSDIYVSVDFLPAVSPTPGQYTVDPPIYTSSPGICH